MELNNIQPAAGAKHAKRRVGRGIGSGLGKKKCDSINKSKWNPELIAWREKTVNTEANKQQQSIGCHF